VRVIGSRLRAGPIHELGKIAQVTHPRAHGAAAADGTPAPRHASPFARPGRPTWWRMPGLAAVSVALLALSAAGITGVFPSAGGASLQTSGPAAAARVRLDAGANSRRDALAADLAVRRKAGARIRQPEPARAAPGESRIAGQPPIVTGRREHHCSHHSRQRCSVHRNKPR